MFYTTVELIAQASSNSHILFCFCNVIILMLFVGGSKSSARNSNDCKYATMSFSRDVKMTYSTTLIDDDRKQDDITSKEEEEVEEEEEELRYEDDMSEDEMGKEENLKFEEEKQEEQEEQEQEKGVAINEEDEDELRKKFEEFIIKMKGQLRSESFSY